MSEHFFAATPWRSSPRLRERISAVVEPLGVTLAGTSRPGDGARQWLAAPNRGDSVNRETEARCMEALRRAGLVSEDGDLLRTERR